MKSGRGTKDVRSMVKLTLEAHGSRSSSESESERGGASRAGEIAGRAGGRAEEKWSEGGGEGVSLLSRAGDLARPSRAAVWRRSNGGQTGQTHILAFSLGGWRGRGKGGKGGGGGDEGRKVQSPGGEPEGGSKGRLVSLGARPPAARTGRAAAQISQRPRPPAAQSAGSLSQGVRRRPSLPGALVASHRRPPRPCAAAR